jgi:hemolysin activation/secretion protein
MRHRCRTLFLLILGALAGPVLADDEDKTLADLEARKAVIGEITLQKADVFDLNNPEEDRWLFRQANRFHIDTRDSTIYKHLLFKPGELYSKRLLDESERILRNKKYIYDANIKALPGADGKVDIVVDTRDVWSLSPELSISRSGGETRTRFGLEETNLLGRGQALRIVRDNDIDRSENTIEFSDSHLGRSWVSALLRFSDNSDGDSHLVSVARPFYALDTRWSAGGTVLGDDRRTPLYSFGEEAAEFRHKRDYVSLYGGWSQGLRDGRVWRWTAGIVHDKNRFSEVQNPTLPQAIPANRELVYPFLGFERIEDDYVTTSNRDQIGKTEDFRMGLRVSGSLGWSDEGFGSDRDALLFRAGASRGLGSLEKTALLLSATGDGRLESGHLRNSKLTINARYYHRQSDKSLFFALLDGTAGHALDLDNLVEIGGKSGLRGYPLRYQVGDSRLLTTIEQRYFTDWYPFRFARVGAAVFADAGRVWGPNPLGPDNRGWLVDVGVGLRFALTRVSDRVVHLDLAFPINGDDSIDSVQILLESRKSF